MKNRNFEFLNTALVSLVLTGAFSFNSFAEKKSSQAETIKPKVKEKFTPKTETVEIDEDNSETPIRANQEPSNSSPSSSNNAGILGMGAPHSHSIGLGLGQTFPFGAFKKYGDSRISLPDLLYTYSASYSFDFLLDVHYTTHKTTDRELKLFGFAPAVKAKLFQFDAFSPFVLGGLGFYLPQWEDHGVATHRKLVFGTNIGIGGDLKLNQNFMIGVLFTHHNPFDVKQDSGPTVEGHYAKMLLTGMYTF